MNKKDELIAAAKDLNAVLGLDPAIDITDPIEEIEKDIKEAGALVTKEDSIEESTRKVIEEISKGGEEASMKKKETKKKSPAEKKAPSVKKEEKTRKKEGNETSSISNKGKVWLEWNKGVSGIDILKKACHSEIKESSIKGWVKEWNKGKNLPLIARKK